MKTISIELFRGASPETIDAMVMELFKNHEEITIIELECTYGSYLESINALKEDIALYLATNKIEPIVSPLQQISHSRLSIAYFMDVPAEKLNDKINELWNHTNEITIIELDATYTNTPGSVALMKKDIAFYASVKEQSVVKPKAIKLRQGIINFLLGFSVIGIVVSIIMMIGGLLDIGSLCLVQFIIYTAFFNHIINLGDIVKNQEERIAQLENSSKKTI